MHLIFKYQSRFVTMEFARVLCDQYALSFVRSVLENVYVNITWNNVIFTKTEASPQPIEITAPQNRYGASRCTIARTIGCIITDKTVPLSLTSEVEKNGLMLQFLSSIYFVL